MTGVRFNGRCAAVVLVAAASGALLSSGCATCGKCCSHCATDSTVQVQFYGPIGSRVMLHDEDHSTSEIWSSGPLGDRLEHQVEDYAVFNLPPGRYGFAYVGAPGAEDSSIYGELQILRPSTPTSRNFVRHTFIPVRLLSVEHQEAEHLFPTRDNSYTVGLEDREFDHLKQGDMIEQVYFVADLERAKKEHDVCYFQRINDIDRKLSVIADKAEYLDVRYTNARRTALLRMPEVNIEDKIAQENFDIWGIDETYVRLAAQRQGLERQRESLLIERRHLEDERGRREALLRSIKIVHRAGAMVLATPDLKLPFRDSVDQASQLGDVLAVLRIGGRHEYWAQGRDTMSGADSDDMPQSPR